MNEHYEETTWLEVIVYTAMAFIVFLFFILIDITEHPLGPWTSR